MNNADSVTTTVISLSPEAAQSLLDMNTHNRPQRSRHLDRLVETMRQGLWKFNGDAIRVSSTGRLLDGQHRCAAVVLSGVTIQTLLVTGLPDDTFVTIDVGSSRTGADMLSIAGEVNCRNLAAITRLVLIFERIGDYRPSGIGAAADPTHEQIIRRVDEDLRTASSWVSSNPFTRKYLTGSLGGFCRYLFDRHSEEASRTFWEKLETGANLQADDPVLLLRNRLLEQGDKTATARRYLAALVFKAFKAHTAGRRLKTLRVRTEGSSAELDLFKL
jgi:hypothetical protein